MARLTIEQIRAPDLSVASQATARAGEAFQGAMSSATDLLGKYQQGMEAQGDAEITNLLAGAKNEDEWNSIVDKVDFSKMNLSADMRNSIINRRDEILGYQSQRADEANTRSITSTRDAVEADRNAENDFQVGRREASIGRAGAALEAAVSGATYGFGGNNGTDRRNQWREGIASIESDGSGGYEAVGATNPTLGRALGRYQIMEANIPQWSKEALGREVTAEEFMANPDIQDAIFDHKFGGYVEQYGEEGAAQAWFGGEGGVGETDRTDVHGRLNIGDYGQKFVNAIGRPTATQNPNQLNPQQARYVNMLANSGYNTEDEVLGAMQDMFDINSNAQTAISAADEKLFQETIANRVFEAASLNSDPVQALLEFENLNAGMKPSERIRASAMALEQAGDGGAFAAERLRLGLTGMSPEQMAVAESAMSLIEERQDRSPVTVALKASEVFQEDPATKMTEALDGLGISTKPSDVESAINSLASRLGITRAEAAYSYARAAEQETRLGRALSLGGDNLSNWGAEEFAEQNFVGNGAEASRAQLADDRILAQEIQSAATLVGRLESDIQKARQQGRTPTPQQILNLTAAQDRLSEYRKSLSNN
jgi:hypothetical protein